MYALSTALHRFLPWSRSTAPKVPYLPNEIVFEEIPSHILLERPTSLSTLRVAFTCKELYRKLQPVLARFYVDRLVEAYAKGNLVAHAASAGLGNQFITLETFRSNVEAAFEQNSLGEPAQPPSPENQDIFPSFNLTYSPHFGTFDDSDALWGLSSLLSMPHVAKHLRYFEIVLTPNRPATDDEPHSRTPSDEWRRAFTAALCRAFTEPEGIEMLLWGDYGKIEGDRPEQSLGPLLFSPSSFAHSCIRELSLTGSILSLFGPSPINSFLQNSFITLTRFNLCQCNTLTTKEWGTLMSGCQFPFLEQFYINDSNIPLNVLTSFLLSNPFITNAEVRVSPRCRSRLEMGSEDRPKFLPRLRKLIATTDFLLALFNPTSKEDETVPLFNLESLCVVAGNPRGAPRPKAGTADYGDVTKVLSRISPPNQGTQKNLIALRTIELELPYNRGVTEDWLASGFLTNARPRQSEDIAGGVLSSLFHAASDFIQPPPAPLPDLPDTLASLTHITAFHIRMGDPDNWNGSPPTFAIHPGVLVSFISSLPGLEVVILDGVFGRPRAAVTCSAEFWGSLASVWDVCPKLRGLEMDGLGGSETRAMWNRGEPEPTPRFLAWTNAFFT